MVTSVGLVVGAATPLVKIYDQQQKMAVSAENNNQISTALREYIDIHGRLPCPAPLDADMDTADFGKEISAGSGCNDASVTHAGIMTREGRDGETVQIGAVPVRTLGISDHTLVDGWGNRFIYAVSGHFTTGSPDFTKDNGAINLLDSNDNHVTSAPGNVIYIVLSMGSRDVSSININGYETAACEKVNAGDSECYEDGVIRIRNNDSLDNDISGFSYMASAQQYRWEREYSSCGCPSKLKSATVTCVDLNVDASDPGRIVSDANCLGERPDDSPIDCSGEIMNVGNCFGWFTPDWGACPCDATITRTSRCVERDRNAGSLMSTISTAALSCDREADLRPFPIVETMNCGACPDNDGGGDGGGGGGDPLILDLNNDGIHMTAINEGVMFDMNNDGIRDVTAWVNPDDGLLFMDRNDNGTVDGQIELFGDMEKLIGAYQDLTQYDSNNDGLISPADQIWAKLQVWQDKNSNGISEEGELKSLDHWDITEISLGYEAVEEVVAGNDVKAHGTFTRVVNGLQTIKSRISEVWFSFFTG